MTLLLRDVAAGIRVLQVRDGILLSEKQILERARNIVMGLVGNYRIETLDGRDARLASRTGRRGSPGGTGGTGMTADTSAPDHRDEDDENREDEALRSWAGMVQGR